MITSRRITTDLIEQDIAKQLAGKVGRRIMLIDQDFTTSLDVEIIDVRKHDPTVLDGAPLTHVIYAVDQDDRGLPFVLWLIERRIKFHPVFEAQPAQWVHKDDRARTTIESEYAHQSEAQFDKFDFGYGDAENICQALQATRSLAGAYVEVGCFRGSSGRIALKYMQEAGIYRPSYFLDVFDGFTYSAAQESADAIWANSHATEGIEIVSGRLKEFEQPLLGRSVHVVKNNIVTDELPAEIDTIAAANLDVDQLEAVYAGLIKLAPRIEVGGILIVEDPGHTPLLIGAQAALELFLAGQIAEKFLPIYMSSGQYFLVRVK